MPQTIRNTAGAVPKIAQVHQVTHDLIATPPPDEQGTTLWPATYRVFEVSADNFEITARKLRQEDLLQEGICPLVLTNFSPSSDHLSCLPATVPWMRRLRAGDTQLEALRQVLVEPLQSRGLICVDFVDYAAALTFGGEIRLLRADGADLSAATDRVRRKVQLQRRCGHEAAICLAVHVSDVVPLQEVDSALSTVFDEFIDAPLHVASVNLRQRAPRMASVSVLSVSKR